MRSRRVWVRKILLKYWTIKMWWLGAYGSKGNTRVTLFIFYHITNLNSDLSCLLDFFLSGFTHKIGILHFCWHLLLCMVRLLFTQGIQVTCTVTVHSTSRNTIRYQYLSQTQFDSTGEISPTEFNMEESCTSKKIVFSIGKFGGDKILVVEPLKQRGFHLISRCTFCRDIEEKINHLLLRCPAV